MLDAQDGRCAICGEGPSGSGAAGRLHVDHSHKDGTVRALLCNGCNRGLGYFGDSPDLLMSAVAYLLGFQNVLEMRDPRSGGTGATSQVIA